MGCFAALRSGTVQLGVGALYSLPTRRHGTHARSHVNTCKDSPHKRDSFLVFLMAQHRIALHTKHMAKRVLRGWSLCQEDKI